MACQETAKTDLLKDLSPDLKGKFIEFAVKRENQGFRDAPYIISTLRTLIRREANLIDPESVKQTLKKIQAADSTKRMYAIHYETFLKFLGGTWDRPVYKPKDKNPFIPTEEELDQLIAGFPEKLAILCQLLKETGVRIGEACSLKWEDIDFERRIVSVNDPEKGSEARLQRISNQLIIMLNRLPRTKKTIFAKKGTIQAVFNSYRKRVAHKLANPRLLKIHLHTFRHWYATNEYLKMRDIYYVKRKLGHKNVTNTERYMHIAEALLTGKPDEFISKTARNVEETCILVESGFEYVCDFNEIKVFRKRK